MIEKILERLREQREVENVPQDTDYWSYVGAVSKCEEIVQEVAKEYGNGWIPCSERLPENTESVLITTAFEVVMMAFLGTSKKWCYPNGRRIGDSQDMPIAWQPLPAPYQKGE